MIRAHIQKMRDKDLTGNENDKAFYIILSTYRERFALSLLHKSRNFDACCNRNCITKKTETISVSVFYNLN